MYRQGDVLLIPTSGIDLTAGKPIQPIFGRYILAEGEATGHHHSIGADVCDGLFDLAGKTVLVVDQPAAMLTHQEHGAIAIAPGQYWVVRQREYTPQEIRRVMD